LSKKEIKVFTQMFYPDIAATAKVLSDLFFNLNKDFKINVVSQNRSYVNPDIKYEKRTNINNVNINRFEIGKINKNNIFSRIFGFVKLYFSFKKELKNSNEEIFFCVSNPPFLPYLTVKEAKKKNKKSVFLLHDLYPDVLEKLNKIKKSSLVFKIIKKMNKYAFENSSKIIVLGRDAKEYLINNYNINEDKIETITNWSKNDYKSINYNFRKDYNLEKDFLIMYTGNIGETAEFETLLETAKKIENENIKFVIIGNGRKKQKIKHEIEKLKIKNILLLNYQPEEKYYDVLNSADLFYLSLNKQLKGISVPSKTYTYLSIGKPLIAVVPEKSEIGLSIKEDNYGIYNNYNFKELSKDILNLYNDKKLYEAYKINAKETFNNKYNREQVIEKYTKLFKELEEK
jgi:glycosyltransferase involved in cell wall biosynthesis